eukprot:2380780-Pyramimonas_sp.AAC.1
MAKRAGLSGHPLSRPRSCCANLATFPPPRATWVVGLSYHWRVRVSITGHLAQRARKTLRLWMQQRASAMLPAREADA